MFKRLIIREVNSFITYSLPSNKNFKNLPFIHLIHPRPDPAWQNVSRRSDWYFSIRIRVLTFFSSKFYFYTSNILKFYKLQKSEKSYYLSNFKQSFYRTKMPEKHKYLGIRRHSALLFKKRHKNLSWHICVQ